MYVSGSIIALASVVAPASSLPFGKTTNVSSTIATTTSGDGLWQSPENWHYYGSCIDEGSSNPFAQPSANSDWLKAFGKGFTMGNSAASPTTPHGDPTSYSMSLKGTKDTNKWCMVTEIQDCYFDFKLVKEIRAEFDVSGCDATKGNGAWVSPIWMTRGWKGCYGEQDPCKTSGEIDFLESGNDKTHKDFWTNFAGGEHQYNWTVDKDNLWRKDVDKISPAKAVGAIVLTKKENGIVSFQYCPKASSPREECTTPIQGSNWYNGQIGQQSGCELPLPRDISKLTKTPQCIFKFVGSIWNSTLGTDVVPINADTYVPNCKVGVTSLRLVPYATSDKNQIFYDHFGKPVKDIEKSKCSHLLTDL